MVNNQREHESKETYRLAHSHGPRASASHCTDRQSEHRPPLLTLNQESFFAPTRPQSQTLRTSTSGKETQPTCDSMRGQKYRPRIQSNSTSTAPVFFSAASPARSPIGGVGAVSVPTAGVPPAPLATEPSLSAVDSRFERAGRSSAKYD